jgi:hypothetical protein
MYYAFGEETDLTPICSYIFTEMSQHKRADDGLCQF